MRGTNKHILIAHIVLLRARCGSSAAHTGSGAKNTVWAQRCFLAGRVTCVAASRALGQASRALPMATHVRMQCLCTFLVSRSLRRQRS
jgi:hypothetical protein